MANAQDEKVDRRPAVTQTGVVESISGTRTVRVALNTLVRHRRYGKYLRRRTRLLVHDADGEAGVGDLVEIAQCRPISKQKSWRLVRVLEKADRA